MSLDAKRTARLLFDRELAEGHIAPAALDHAAVRRATAVRPVPPRPVRIGQRFAMKLAPSQTDARLTAPLVAARRAVLGAAAAAPPRFLVRMDEYPHYQVMDDPARLGDESFAPWRDIMAAAGCRHLVAVVPAPCLRPLDPDGTEGRELVETEVARLGQLRADGAELALHGYDHRTRRRRPRRYSELIGLTAAQLDDRLTRGERVMTDRVGVRPRVFVPPFNRFAHPQYNQLARRYDVVCGGPESVFGLGLHPGPQWRGEGVWLPAYPPLYGTAAGIIAAAERHIAEATGLWVAIVLHWGWEQGAGWDGLRRLAERIAPYAVGWDEFLAAVERSR